MLQYFPPPEDPAISRALNATLKRIITGSDVAKNINKNMAQHAIVFEAIGLALALDADPDLLNAGGCTDCPPVFKHARCCLHHLAAEADLLDVVRHPHSPAEAHPAEAHHQVRRGIGFSILAMLEMCLPAPLAYCL